MKFFLISDNTDTLAGMRLAGIEGVLSHSREETLISLEKAQADPDVAVILLTGRLSALCAEVVDDHKLNRHGLPLLVEIPDRHGTGRAEDSITRYVRESVGLNI